MSLNHYQALVPDAVRDKDGVISTTQRDTAIQTAVLRYSQDRPRVLVEDITSAGGYVLPLPFYFRQGFSELQRIEQPIGNEPESCIELPRVRLYQSPTETQIKLPTWLLAGDVARVSYTARHELSADYVNVLDETVAGTDTIPLEHRNAVVCYAASLLCEQLANNYATSVEPTIGADAVNHASKTETFAARARALRGQYLKDLGIDEKRLQAASATTAISLPASDGGARMFRRGVRAR